ncbi:MAG: type II toxin-antitoxin system Phd/YefM family antitoxin [Acidimicrobiales bacterium]
MEVAVTIRELRNHGGDVVARVAAGEPVVVTRSGEPVARLIPFRRRGLDAATLLSRWRLLPPVDAGRLRADLDEVLDSSV